MSLIGGGAPVGRPRGREAGGRRPAPRGPRLRRAVAGLALGAVLGTGCAADPTPAAVPGLPPAVRDELSKLRADLADQRAAAELSRRAAIEHVDRRSLELRAELQAVQQATRAELRHVEQRVDEVKTPPSPPAAADTLEPRLAALADRVQALERRLAEAAPPAAPAPPPAPPAAVPHAAAPARVGSPAEQLRTLAARSAEVAAAAHLQLGDLAAAAGDGTRASAEYLRAVEVAPRGPDAARALLALGDAYRKDGRTRLAREAWTRLTRDFPGTDAARTARARLDVRP